MTARGDDSTWASWADSQNTRQLTSSSKSGCISYLAQRAYPRSPALAHLLRHRETREVDSELIHKPWLVWPVDERMRLANPKFVHSGPVADNDGSLVTENALVDGGPDLAGPLREDGGVVLPRAAAQLVQMAYERES